MSRRCSYRFFTFVPLVLLSMGCPVPFGYYAAGNKLVMNIDTGEGKSSSPVSTPTFVDSTAGGATVPIFGSVTTDTDKSISLKCATEGALIYYTFAVGTTPPDPNPYKPVTHFYKDSSPIVAGGDGTVLNIKAIAFKPLMLPSAIAAVTVTIRYSHTPVITQAVAGTDNVILAWDSVAGASSYNLYFRQGTTVSKADGVLLRGVNSPRTIRVLQGGLQFAFAVTAVVAGIESAASTTVVVRPFGDDPSTGFAVLPSSNTRLYAEWKELGDVEVYQIYEDSSPTGGFENLVFDGVGSTFQKIVDSVAEPWESTYLGTFAPGEIHYFKLVAYYWYPDNVAASSMVVPAATYTNGDMPKLEFMETGGYAHPTTPPPGAASGDSWLRSTALNYNAWTQGPWTYLLWDSNDVGAMAFAITVYDPSGTLYGEWINETNSWIYGLGLDSTTWNLDFAGKMGLTEIPLRNLKL